MHHTQRDYEKYLNAKSHHANQGGDQGRLSFSQYGLFYDAL